MNFATGTNTGTLQESRFPQEPINVVYDNFALKATQAQENT